jgi:hypothetical protein
MRPIKVCGWHHEVRRLGPPPKVRITSLKVGGVGGDYIEKGEGSGGGAVGGWEVDEAGSERVYKRGFFQQYPLK